MTFEAFLPRFAVSRLISWWRARGPCWNTSSTIAVGRMVGELRGVAKPISPKFEREIVKARDAVWRHFLHEQGPGEFVFAEDAS